MKDRVTTRAGQRRLEQLLDAACRRYAEIVQTNPEAAEAGDSSVWHDNFAYEENQRQMHQWSRRVHDLRETLATLEVISPPACPREATVGCTLEVVDQTTGQRRTLLLAGFGDGDPLTGRVSYTAPLGQALLGARAGEQRAIRLGAAEHVFEVLAIRATEED